MIIGSIEKLNQSLDTGWTSKTCGFDENQSVAPRCILIMPTLGWSIYPYQIDNITTNGFTLKLYSATAQTGVNIKFTYVAIF